MSLGFKRLSNKHTDFSLHNIFMTFLYLPQTAMFYLTDHKSDSGGSDDTRCAEPLF